MAGLLTQDSIETIGIYQRRGLLAKPDKPLGGVRHFNDSHTQLILFIKQGQTLSFSLADIAELLGLEDGQHCCEAQEIALRKLALIKDRIASLQKMAAAPSDLVHRCTDNESPVTCPIIITLQKEKAYSPCE